MKRTITVQITLDQPRPGARPDRIVIRRDGKRVRKWERGKDELSEETRFFIDEGDDWILAVSQIDL